MSRISSIQFTPELATGAFQLACVYKTLGLLVTARSDSLGLRSRLDVLGRLRRTGLFLDAIGLGLVSISISISIRISINLGFGSGADGGVDRLALLDGRLVVCSWLAMRWRLCSSKLTLRGLCGLVAVVAFIVLGIFGIPGVLLLLGLVLF